MPQGLEEIETLWKVVKVLKGGSDLVNYGPVYVDSGRYKGRIGYFDDEDVNSKSEPIGYVSFGDPLLCPFREIRLQYLRKPTKEGWCP